MESKLATIFECDVIGYSRLMGEDELGTLEKLDQCLKIISGLVDKHRGRIFNTAGDAVLVEFASALDAVRFSVEFQTEIKSLKNGIEYRVGLHTGEVYVYGTNLLGDTVNVAARIESMADHGGISLSETVHDLVASKLKEYKFVNRGAQEFKNIAKPVQIYSIDIPDTKANPNVKPKEGPKFSQQDLVKTVLHDQAAANKTVQDAQHFKRDRKFGPATRILMWRITRKDGAALNELLDLAEKKLVPSELNACVVAILSEFCKNIDSDRAMRISAILEKEILGSYRSLSIKFLAQAAKTNSEAQYKYAMILLDDHASSTSEIEEAIEHLVEAGKRMKIPAMLKLAEYYGFKNDKKEAFKWLYAARSFRDTTANNLLEKMASSMNRTDFTNFKFDAEALVDEIKFLNEDRQ